MLEHYTEVMAQLASWLEHYGEATANICDLVAFVFITPEIVEKFEEKVKPVWIFYPWVILLSVPILIFIIRELLLGRYLIAGGVIIGFVLVILCFFENSALFILIMIFAAFVEVFTSLRVGLAISLFFAARLIGVLGGLLKMGWFGG